MIQVCHACLQCASQVVQNGAAQATEDEEGRSGVAGLHHSLAWPGALLLLLNHDAPATVVTKATNDNVIIEQSPPGFTHG